MATTVDYKKESSVDLLIDKAGVLIGTIEPTRESKGAWSEIYQVEKDFYNRIYGDIQNGEMVLIEKLDNKEELVNFLPDLDLNTID